MQFFCKFVFVAIVAMLFSFDSSNLLAQKQEPTISIGAEIEIARPKKGCKHGLWVCVIKVKPEIKFPLPKRMAAADISLEGNQVILDFKSDLPAEVAESQEFYAENGESYTFSQELLDFFEKQHIELKPGRYPIDFSTNTKGIVKIEAIIR